MIDYDFVVVGAGLPGIISALVIAAKGQRCLLLETAPSIGGLLRSYEVDGYTYDLGPHFANFTGIDHLDYLLFGGKERDWKEYPFLAAGNFWNGKLNEVSDSPDLTSLPVDLQYKCLGEILSAPGWHADRDPENAEEFLLSEYGQALVDLFFDPIFEKLTGKRSDSLNYRANLLFNLKRFCVLDVSATFELKKSQKFDSRVAFHHRKDFKFHKPCLYPKNGGIGSWIGQLEEKLYAASVDVRTNAQIEQVYTQNGMVRSLSIDGKMIATNNLVWSAAPASLCKLMGVDLKLEKHELRSTILVGLAFDRKFLSECDYITVLDPEFLSFRVTLYDNFRETKSSMFAATVEFIVAADKIDVCDWVRIAEDEIKRMGLCDNKALLKSQHLKVIPNGFPVQSNKSIACLNESTRVARSISNVHLIGRASGEGWFLDDLIRQSYQTSMAIVDSQQR
jgi:protoporphyrinogen oxidase